MPDDPVSGCSCPTAFASWVAPVPVRLHQSRARWWQTVVSNFPQFSFRQLMRMSPDEIRMKCHLNGRKLLASFSFAATVWAF